MRVKRAMFFGVASMVLAVITFNLFFNWHSSEVTRSSVYASALGNLEVSKSYGKRRVVCPERYAGPKHTSETKWAIVTCDYGVPLSELVTIVLAEPDKSITSVVQRTLPGVPVVVPDTDNTAKSGSINYVPIPKSSTPGVIWNTLISASDTPYTFLAINVLNFSMDLIALQRLVRVLSETYGTYIVGGATRNVTGHWRAGCYQMTLKNYVLSYHKGYHESISECMRCDHVDGPFLAETQFLRQVPMDISLSASMLFPDFFLKIFRTQNSLLCPDAMLDANDLLASPSASDRRLWGVLAARWQLNRVRIRSSGSSILHRFNCSEAGLNCQALDVKMTKALPVCCREEFGRLVKFWAKFASEHGIRYQFLTGSLLGAVKMGDLMPWDIDGDMYFDRSNYSFVKASIKKFKEAGIQLLDLRSPSAGLGLKSWGYMRMVFSGFFIEMYAAPLHLPPTRPRMIPDETVPPGVDPFAATKVELHGAWVAAPPNPGRYARGLYGRDILKHAMSWRHTGKKADFEPYEAGRFDVTCDDAGHHACLSGMPADGSIYYDVPEC